MTAAKVEVADNARLLSGIACAIGVFLLADSVSQLVQAAGSFQWSDRLWRLSNLRLLFTQVTPITLGLLFVGQFLVQREGGWGRIGLVALMLGLVMGVFTVGYVVDAVAVAKPLSGPALGQLKRNSVQVGLSGALLTLVLLVSGFRARRLAAAA